MEGEGYHSYLVFWRKKIYTTQEIFTISGTPKHTFVERQKLSKDVSRYMKHPDVVLLLLGYSKSGKTVFREKYFEKNKFQTVVFRSKPDSTSQDLYNLIASELKLSIESEKITSNAEGKTKGKNTGHIMGLENRFMGKLIGRKSSSYSENENKTNSVTLRPAISNPQIDVNFLCKKLSNRNILILIEDYHMLNEKFSESIAVDLKHFLDEKIFFLIIGVPSNANRTLKHNPDLSGRMQSLFFDHLEIEEAKEIIQKGTKLLNVIFSENIITQIVNHSFLNAYLVQFISRTLLLINGVNETIKKGVFQPKPKFISDEAKIKEACKIIANCTLNNDYATIRNNICLGLRPQTNDIINQYKEILDAIKHYNLEKLREGISIGDVLAFSYDRLINKGIADNDGKLKGLIRGKLTQGFSTFNNVVNKAVKKPILHEEDKKIYVNDLLFKFYGSPLLKQ